MFIVYRWKWTVALGLRACSLNRVVKPIREVDKSSVDSSSAKGSAGQRIASLPSSQSRPEEGCVFSNSLLPLELQLLAL